MDALLSNFTAEVLWSLFVFTIVGWVVIPIVIPLILVRIPPHYFDERHPRTWMENHHPALRWFGRAVKNALGLVLLLAGIAMLVLPGQGVLTILLGVALLDFPGKRQLERKLVGLPTVLRTINKLREKFGRPPLTVYGGSGDKVKV
ncbi:MAG: PGPGW domain-containing protein [Nitrospiraceae bacterium]